jgi:hypothetical protein
MSGSQTRLTTRFQHSARLPTSCKHSLARFTGSVAVVIWLALAAACSGGAGRGEACSIHDDCRTALQCSNQVCTDLCNRALDCGDGSQCTASGYCIASKGRPGDTCLAETACAAGLSCVLDGTDVDHDGVMQATCQPDQQGHPLGAECLNDSECRNGTCAIGHCVDVCVNDRDCGVGQVCTSLPRVEAEGAQFFACLPSTGTLTFDLPAQGPGQKVLIAVPGNAQSFSLTMSIDDPNERVGLTSLISPRGRMLYSYPISREDYYGNLVRHVPLRRQSVALVPSSLNREFEKGAYRVDLQSFRNTLPGSATPRTTVAIKLGEGVSLDLHLRFADFVDHPCREQLGTSAFNAASALRSEDFQQYFISTLRTLLGHGGVTLGRVTYDDVIGHPELDSVTPESVGTLFAKTDTTDGVALYFVRSISPAGLAAIGNSPGPAGRIGTSQSGIALTMESMCYRSWSQLARTAAHEIAGYLGLFPNRDIIDGLDPISDTSDGSDNLMFYSELGGTELTTGQSEILRRSPVLQ